MSSSAYQQLTGRLKNGALFAYRTADVLPLQIEAADASFQATRALVPVLDQCARDHGIDRIASRTDLIPLLFSHTTYKSYPESLVTKGRWPVLSAWLDGLSTIKGAADVDMAGVADVDGWLDRLHAAGHIVYSSSGTTGKCSFAQQSPESNAIHDAYQVAALTWATGVEADRSRPGFSLYAPKGYFRPIHYMNTVLEYFARPDQRYWISDEPLHVADANRMGMVRRAIADGTARPGDLVRVEREAADRQARMARSMDRLIDDFVRHRDEPVVIAGLVAQHYAFVMAMRERGVEPGLHPDSMIFRAGNLKNASVPADYREQIDDFYRIDPSRVMDVYGMSEANSALPRCSAGRFHFAPWHIPIVLAKDGESLAERSDDGLFRGRMASLDLSTGGRWGGVISGDRVVVDMGSTCPCGTPSPSVLTIDRYVDLPEGDDKLSCAGTIEAYVRGAIQS